MPQIKSVGCIFFGGLKCREDRNFGKKMMGEEIMRTVEFLRGRLLAERVASRKAKEEAELMGNKVVYLETKLKEETKSRNKAEKRLKFLKKKMESMNLSYVSDESENSSTKDSAHCYQEMEKIKTGKGNLGADSSESLSGKCEMKEQAGDANAENMNSSSESDLVRNQDISMADANSMRTSLELKEMDAKNNLHREKNVDDSLAIVPVEMPKKNQSIDPDVLDATVRDVLTSLRHAKEKLQNQIWREYT